MATPAEVVVAAVELVNEWHRQATAPDPDDREIGG
jgi:hypothetical protein